MVELGSCTQVLTWPYFKITEKSLLGHQISKWGDCLGKWLLEKLG